MTAERQRHRAQLAFVASGAELEVGHPADCPLPLQQLLATTAHSPWVRRHFAGGLTAEVYRLEAGGRQWTLKRARERCKVANVDGQTSFLNEVQRRADIQRLKARAGGAERFQALADTQYASYRRGILLSPWIDGEAVREWDERRLLELFDCLHILLLEGLFEWDLCPGNILDDGRIRLFDFGYLYRFDPLRDFNSNGRSTPQCHAAERFETRCYYAHLLHLERCQGQAAARAALELEKRIALEAYQRLRHSLSRRGACGAVLAWLDGILGEWRQALRHGLDTLYLREAWRSHWSDLDDDLRGQTCTALTLQRLDWLQGCLTEQASELQRLGLLQQNAQQVHEQLAHAREQASLWQIG